MAEDAATHYDFSEYPLDHPLYSAMNRKALWFLQGRTEFGAYATVCWSASIMLRCSCTPTQWRRRQQRVSNAGWRMLTCSLHTVDALNNFHTLLCWQNLIKSTLHTARRVHMCKVGLTAYDTKRWLCDDTIHTHGHQSTLL